MSEKKQAWWLKWRDAADHDDIRYLGPISYRAFEMLGWICVVLSVALVILAIITSVSPEAGAGQSVPRQILPYATQISGLLLVIAGISRAMRNSQEYSQQLLTYLGVAGIVAAGTALIFQRTVMAVVDKLFLDPKQVLPLIEKAFTDYSGIGFIAFNAFIDIFLCILMFYFVNVRPKHFFTGKWTLFLRACAALPVVYEVVCMVLKYQAVCQNRVLPFACFPLLTVKPVTVYGLFLFLAIYVKRREIQYCGDGHSIEECQASMLTRRNSLRFGIVLAIALAVTAIVDNLFQFGAAQLLLKPFAPAGGDAMAWSLRTARRIGFGGDSLIMLVAAPFMLLYSFNRIPRWRIFSILAPLLAVGLAVLLWQGSRQTDASQYIVEGKISKINITAIQQALDYAKKISDVIVSLFSA